MNQIKITTGKGEFLFVELPEDAEKVNIFDKADRNSWTDTHELGSPHLQYFRHGYWQFPITLPYSKYTYLCTSKGIGEEDAGKIVEKDYFDGIGYQYPRYSIKRKWSFGMRFDKATESFENLLKANQLDENKTFAILKLNS